MLWIIKCHFKLKILKCVQSFQTTTTIGSCNTKCSFTKSLSRSMNVHTTILTHLLGRIYFMCLYAMNIHTYLHTHTHTYKFELYYTKTTAALTWCTRTQLTNPLNKTISYSTLIYLSLLSYWISVSLTPVCMEKKIK